MTKEDKATWSALVKLEPRLEDLRSAARAIKDLGNEQFCANTAWYNKLKPRLVHLVGFEAARKEARTMEAYDTAYRLVYKELPSCRNCNCF
jgi:hypothetical protein